MKRLSDCPWTIGVFYSIEFETKECFLRNEIFSNFTVQRYPEVANVKCHFKENSGRKLQSMKPQNLNSPNSCFFSRIIILKYRPERTSPSYGCRIVFLKGNIFQEHETKGLGFPAQIFHLYFLLGCLEIIFLLSLLLSSGSRPTDKNQLTLIIRT